MSKYIILNLATEKKYLLHVLSVTNKLDTWMKNC